MIIDFASCIVTGGASLRQRVENISANYDPMCADYFSSVLSKRGEAFCDSACGVLLLDGLLIKNKINRAELVITVDEKNRPRVSGDGLDFSISHSEGCAFVALAVGEGASVGCDVQRIRDYSDEKMSELSKAFMSSSELSEFEAGGRQPLFFFRAWTHRESFVKRAGADIFDSLGTSDTLGEYYIDGIIEVCGERYCYSINRPPLADEEKEEAQKNESSCH